MLNYARQQQAIGSEMPPWQWRCSDEQKYHWSKTDHAFWARLVWKTLQTTFYLLVASCSWQFCKWILSYCGSCWISTSVEVVRRDTRRIRLIWYEPFWSFLRGFQLLKSILHLVSWMLYLYLFKHSLIKWWQRFFFLWVHFLKASILEIPSRTFSNNVFFFLFRSI